MQRNEVQMKSNGALNWVGSTITGADGQSALYNRGGSCGGGASAWSRSRKKYLERRARGEIASDEETRKQDNRIQKRPRDSTRVLYSRNWLC